MPQMPEMPRSRSVRSSCRTCLAACGVLLELRDDRVVKVKGDPDSRFAQPAAHHSRCAAHQS